MVVAATTLLAVEGATAVAVTVVVEEATVVEVEATVSTSKP